MAWKSNLSVKLEHWILFQTLLLILPLLSTEVRSEEIQLNPTGRDIKLTSLIRVSDTILGEADITITADNIILLPKESTLSLLTSLITKAGIENLTSTSNSEWLSQEDFKTVGLNLTFDFSTLECVITIPEQYSLTRQLSLIDKQNIYSFENPATLSGYLNMSLSANHSEFIGDESSSQDSYNGQFDSALNINRLNFEYESSIEAGSNTDSKYTREGTRLNIDFPKQGTRLVIGDMYNSGRAFQDGSDILGIGLTRDFTIIPTRNVRPRANQSFTLQRTSNVDVYIDGIPVRRLTLGAGSYNLNDIPLARGSNDIELVITDRSGNEERIEFSVATGNGLLNSGEFEYSLMMGVPSEFNNGQRDYLTDEHILHGYLDFGITPWLTLGVNAQAREELYQYGATSLIASAWGVTELNASQSEHPRYGNGNAFKIAFDAQFPKTNSLDPQLSLSYEYMTKSFSGISGLNSNSENIHLTTHYYSAFGSIHLSRSLRTALSLNYRSGVDKENNYWTASPSLSGGLFDTPATWSARVNYQHKNNDTDNLGATFSLSWPLSKRSRVVSRHATKLNESSLNYSYQDHIGNTGGTSIFASAVTNDETDADLNAGVNYAANRYIINASQTSRLTDLNGDEHSHNTNIKVSSAIAFADSKIAIGRPIREAFAIVYKHKSLAENELSIDPTRDGEHARVYLHGNTTTLVPDLVAYNGQNLSYDIKDLPPGYDLGEGAFWLNPGYKNGYSLRVGSDAALTVIGKLIDAQSGQPISLVAGSAYLINNDKHTPIEFFSNRSGIFAISGLKQGQYKLVLDTTKQESVVIDLNDQTTTLIRLGELYVD